MNVLMEYAVYNNMRDIKKSSYKNPEYYQEVIQLYIDINKLPYVIKDIGSYCYAITIEIFNVEKNENYRIWESFDKPDVEKEIINRLKELNKCTTL